MKAQKGFTLIELIMVIVILGILAATALPKFVDFKGEASDAAVAGVAGAISAASGINYAACKAGKTGADCVTVTTCNNAGDVLQGGGMPNGFSISNGATTISSGVAGVCVVSGNSKTASAFVIGAP